MSTGVETALPIYFSDAAAKKVKNLAAEEENPNLNLRVYVTGGGCSGFSYGFTFDEKINDIISLDPCIDDIINIILLLEDYMNYHLNLKINFKKYF